MACSLHVNDNLLQLLINNNILLEVVVRCPLQDELFQANNHRYISLLSNGNLNLRPWAHPIATFSPTYIKVDQPCTSPRVTIYTLVYTGKLKVRVLLLFHVVGWNRLTNQEICLLRCIQKLNTSPVFFLSNTDLSRMFRFLCRKALHLWLIDTLSIISGLMQFGTICHINTIDVCSRTAPWFPTSHDGAFFIFSEWRREIIVPVLYWWICWPSLFKLSFHTNPLATTTEQICLLPTQ